MVTKEFSVITTTSSENDYLSAKWNKTEIERMTICVEDFIRTRNYTTYIIYRTLKENILMRRNCLRAKQGLH